MLSSALVLAMLVAAPADPNPARKGYSNCLQQFLRTSYDAKMTPDDFDKAVPAACGDKEAAFRQAVVALDTSRGVKRKDAEQGVRDEIADFQTTLKERYRDYIDSGTKPPPFKG